MKKIILLTILLHLFLGNTGILAQTNPPVTPQNEPAPPYLSDKGLPSFKILKLDSVTYFNTADIPKGKKSILFFFNPGCSHCIVFLNKLFPAMDSFKNVNFYMFALVPEMREMRKFSKEYNTGKYKNVKVVGRDADFFFITHYAIKTFPGAAIYDENKKFVKLLEGDRLTPGEIYKYTN